ncbi:MAG: pantoate--beta-alanine ligase [Alphaproteobacteria bacterium]|nr:pantoate--beta-alanine ligase [Alphaproteobacteria bacterium]
MATQSRPVIVRRAADVRATVSEWRAASNQVALVPTMGALHAGHLALAEAARAAADRVVVTIFVNPKQFGEGEDFTAYPRDETADLDKLAAAGTDVVYIPPVDEVFPDGFSTQVIVGGLTDVLDGVHRPGHFEGVATVVSKLFLQTQADKAYFGEKDYQQLQVIRRMAHDLDIPIEVVGVPTVREADGLALSSRNAYLTAEQRAVAPVLYRTLCAVARAVVDDVESGSEAAAWGAESLQAAGFESVDYVAVCDAATLVPIERPDRPGRVLGAGHLGRARLIDNVALRRHETEEHV